ncbi:hypothetical protein HRG_014684 [Hirsutella rhossiliensis]
MFWVFSTYHVRQSTFWICNTILIPLNNLWQADSKNAFRPVNISILREKLELTRIASGRDLEAVRELPTPRAQYDFYLFIHIKLARSGTLPTFCLHAQRSSRQLPHYFTTTSPNSCFNKSDSGFGSAPESTSCPTSYPARSTSNPLHLLWVIWCCFDYLCRASILEPLSQDQRTSSPLGPGVNCQRRIMLALNNPARARPDPSTAPAPSSPLLTGEDTIVCAPPGQPDCESDDDMPDADTPEPPLNSSHMTLAEKAGLIEKWADNKQKHDATNSTMSQSRPAERPQGVSIAHWRAIQIKKAKGAEAGAAIPISELERWFATPRIEFNESIAKSPDFLRKWWKEHKDEWPLLAAAARDLLSISGSEVDVERLFSGCRYSASTNTFTECSYPDLQIDKS